MILSVVLHALLAQASQGPQEPLMNHGRPDAKAISTPLFASLERLARLVDTTYCLGSTGIHRPFDCLSRCKEFPEMRLATTWSTGILFGDNCGFIAVDHSRGQQQWPGPGPGPGAGPGSGRVADAQGAIVVAFRGTYSIANTIYDLATLPQKYVPYPSPDHGGGGAPPDKPSHSCDNCTVHMGFLHSWRNARRVVLPELRRLRAAHPGFPVHLVGHSLGGAVACLAALELRVSLGWEDVWATTFGEPRVGNGQLARFVDDVFALGGAGEGADPERSRYRRVTHAGDPVPLLPPTELGFRSHAGELFIAKADLAPGEGDVLLCAGDEDPRCSAGADESVVVRDALGRLSLFARAGLPAPAPASAPVSLDEDPAGLGAQRSWGLPARLRLWQILFAHRDYFWRLGLCIPGGDPSNWGRAPDAPKSQE
ncbi:putative feruloyl esterase A [Escovopsis weberi]|uniref:Putative feruloyl esterase A n=1 Tax=Escovopsis weberi TaxID=150374 RepID=A0A0M9VVP4_ESCWE|nr:putative feruloyl esterase A [Escovopsis weberi]